MNMIAEIKNVTVSYQRNNALRDINLSISENSFVSIIGPNGAGKTTLLTILNGLAKISGGSATILGHDIRKADSSEIRKDIGYVPQHLNIDKHSPISVREAVNIGRFGRIGFFKRWSNEDERVVISAMEKVGITHLAHKPIGHLSGGEHQKVSIARALAQNPKLILLDEPTSKLDPKSQNEIIGLIERIFNEKKYTIVFVTQTLNHIPECCTQIILMKKGKILYAGKPEDALKQDKLAELYGCPIQVALDNGRRHFYVGE